MGDVSTIEIYGHSDDIVCVDGAITEEFYPDLRDNAPCVVAVSDGTLLRVRYDDDGCWRIVPLAKGSAVYEKTEATGSDDEYSDRITLTGQIEWVACGKMAQRVRKAERAR